MRSCSRTSETWSETRGDHDKVQDPLKTLLTLCKGHRLSAHFSYTKTWCPITTNLQPRTLRVYPTCALPDLFVTRTRWRAWSASHMKARRTYIEVQSYLCLFGVSARLWCPFCFCIPKRWEQTGDRPHNVSKTSANTPNFCLSNNKPRVKKHLNCMTTSSATSNSFLSFLPLVSCHLFFLLSTFHLSCRPLFLRLLLLLQTESFTCGSWALSAPLLHAHLLLTPPQRAYHLLHNTYTHIRIHIWIQLSNVIEACHVAVGCTFNVQMGRSGNCERVCACVCKLFITPWNANDSRGEGAATLCRSFPILRGLCAGGEREKEGLKRSSRVMNRQSEKHENHPWQEVEVSMEMKSSSLVFLRDANISVNKKLQIYLL